MVTSETMRLNPSSMADVYTDAKCYVCLLKRKKVSGWQLSGYNQCNVLVVWGGQTGLLNLLYFSAPPFLMHASYEVKMTVHLECTIDIINIKIVSSTKQMQ